jgi:mxaL protein
MRLFSGLQKRIGMNLDKQLYLLLIASALLFVALGRPTAVLKREVYRFVFTFDVTQSMNVSDTGLGGAPVTRLEFAKVAVRRTLEQLPCGSEAGLAIFTEYRSFLLFSPVDVCKNYTVISTMLDKIDWRMAWAARSEVSKGLYSSLSLAHKLGKGTRVIFLSDGHEAPPLHPEFRPQFSGTPGEVRGAIIGIGGSDPMPIPRLNNKGKVVGNWGAREVLQVDTYSLGRTSTLEAEPMVGVDMSDVAGRIAAGTEHLSSLREAYLKQLARETRLDYLRPESPQQLRNWLTQSRFANHKPADTDLRWVTGILALLCLLLAYVTVTAFRRIRPV